MKKSAYIFNDGDLKRKDSTVYFTTEDGNKRYLPIEDLSEIYNSAKSRSVKSSSNWLPRSKSFCIFSIIMSIIRGHIIPGNTIIQVT